MVQINGNKPIKLMFSLNKAVQKSSRLYGSRMNCDNAISQP